MNRSRALARPRLLPAVLAVLLAATAVLASPASPAAAHDELVASDPAADSVQGAVPAAVTLTYSAEVLAAEGATQVQVEDADGAPVTTDPAVTSGTTVTQALPADLANGVYLVLWKVVSSDGHPIAGEFAFTVEVAAPVTPSPEAPPTSTPPPQPTDEAEASTPEATAPAVPAANGGASAAPWIILGIVAVAAVGAVAYLVIARNRGRRSAAAPGAGPPAEGP